MSIVNNFLNLQFPILHQWGYWVIILGAFLEALPLIGTIVPGHALVFFGGFLAKLHILDIGDVMWTSSLAAIFGDLVGYETGRKYGDGLLTHYGKYFFFKPELLEKTKRLVQKHPAKTLIGGRFNLVTRALAPFLAGTSHVPFFRFLLYNIIGGVSWTVSSVLIGYVLGASYEVGAKYIGRAIFITFMLALIFSFGYRRLNKTRHLFKRYHLYLIAAILIFISLFSYLTDSVTDKGSVVKIDVWVNQNIHLIQNSSVIPTMNFVTNLISPVTLPIFALLLLVWFFKKRLWSKLLLTVFALSGGWLGESIFKIIIVRPRPPFALISESDFSFPSGHATLAAIFFLLLAYCFKDKIKYGLRRRLFIVLNIFLFLLVGFSRIYLGAHWFSDVLAGFALGLSWLTLLILIFKIKIQPKD